MIEITDEKLQTITQTAFKGFKQLREQEILHPEHLKEFKQAAIKPLYPHKRDQNNNLRRYLCGQACCDQKSGNFICTAKTAPDSSFIKNGLGVCLYFNFLKHSSLFYFFASLLAIAACAICFIVSIENSQNPLTGYTTFFFSTTYGTFASEHNKCKYSLIGSTNTASVSLSCPYGSLKKLGTVFSTQSLNSLQNCRNQNDKLTLGTNPTSSYLVNEVASCDSQGNNCDITLTFNGQQTFTLVSYNYECYNNVYSVGSISSSSSNFLYAVVAIDLFFCFIYFFFMASEMVSQSKQENFFKTNQLSINDFSIEVEGIHRNVAQKQFHEFVSYCNSQLEQSMYESVFSYTLPECQEMITNHYKQRTAYEHIYKLIKQFYFQGEKSQKQFSECHKLAIEEKGEEAYQQFKKQLREEVDNFLAFKRKQIYKSSTEELPLYLVFDKISSKKKFYDLQQKRCLGDRLIIEDSEYKFKEPPAPDMIQWQNRASWTGPRVLFSWLITLCICLGSYMFFGFVQYQQTKLFVNNNYGIDCNVLFNTAQLTSIDSILSGNSNYQTCICKSQSLLNLATAGSSFCTQWQKQYALYIAIPLLISIGIVFYNIIVSYIFKALTKFEKHKFIVNEQVSYTLKRAFILIMNMGLIMILLNFNFSNTMFNAEEISFLFTGRFNGFTADWYMTIGSIIILTMIFNIAFPIIELILTSVVKCLKKCWDTRCYRVPTSRQTKEEYISLYSEDIFPISERYAYLIATLFVSLVFCGVIPILIPVTAISFFLLYFSDKLLIFKYYQTPINYTQTLQKALMKIIVVAVLGHFALTAYLLSEPTLIAKNDYTISFFDSGNSRLNLMFSTSYIIPYVIFFFGLLIVFFLKSFVYEILFAKCYEMFKNNFIEKDEKFEEVMLSSLLDRRQIQTLIKIGEFNLDNFLMRKNQSLIQSGGLNKTGTEKQFMQRAAVQEELLNHSLFVLNAAKRQKVLQKEDQNQKISLLGIPSYQYLVKSDQLKKNDDIIQFEKKMKQILSKVHIEPASTGKKSDKNDSTGLTYPKKTDESAEKLARIQ